MMFLFSIFFFLYSFQSLMKCFRKKVSPHNLKRVKNYFSHLRGKSNLISFFFLAIFFITHFFFSRDLNIYDHEKSSTTKIKRKSVNTFHEKHLLGFNSSFKWKAIVNCSLELFFFSKSLTRLLASKLFHLGRLSQRSFDQHSWYIHVHIKTWRLLFTKTFSFHETNATFQSYADRFRCRTRQLFFFLFHVDY